MSSLKAAIVDVPDFPKPGILFRDISPVLAAPALFQQALREMTSQVRWADVDVVVGVESRGFILGAALAALHQKGFVPMRKAGKLPPPVHGQTYALEYGEATLELKAGAGRALLVDDVLATGGTLEAALSLCRRAGYDVGFVSVLVNLTLLNRFTFRGQKVLAAVEY
ncbi:MAG: adenine phosphoribosyltransferase [Myxococcaceae bacterium]|nr:adenine phosphoribosyltransferase [Myxococcaceae bacterium]MCA3016289.1 adenine phosphoribosyltransferase [Myxococcaceae bacterium]